MKNDVPMKELTPLTTPCPEENNDPEQQQLEQNPEGSASTTTATKTEYIKCSFSIESPTPTTIKPHVTTQDTMMEVKLEEDDTESDDSDPSASKSSFYAGRSNQDEDLDRLLGLKDGDGNNEERLNNATKNGASTISGSSAAITGTSLNEMVDEDLRNYEHQSLCNKISTCCRSSPSSSSETPFRVGNSIILNSYFYRRFSLCIVGPTWFGCVFTVGLLYFSSYYFIRKALNEEGLVSAMFCVGFTIWSSVSLFFVSCCDPGIVRDKGGDGGSRGVYHNVMNGEDEGWSYCDFCGVYQPPSAAHCPECNVCVEGYDHHCPWMGTCIGKGNMTAFMSFNFSWIFYLLFAFIWVAGVGPNV